MANIWLVDVIRTTHTSPNAPRPITFSTSKSSRLSRRFLINWTTGLTSSMKSVTVFSRRNDELQHSSYSTMRQSSNASTDIVLPGCVIGAVMLPSVAEPNNMLDAPFSMIIDSSWRKRFKPDTAAAKYYNKREDNTTSHQWTINIFIIEIPIFIFMNSRKGLFADDNQKKILLPGISFNMRSVFISDMVILNF